MTHLSEVRLAAIHRFFFIFIINLSLSTILFGQKNLCNPIVRPLTNFFSKCYFNSSKRGYIIGNTCFNSNIYFNEILSTDDNGKTWQPFLYGQATEYSNIFSIGSDTIFVSKEFGGVIRSVDGERSWKSVLKSDIACTRLLFVTSKYGFVLTSRNFIYKTENGGDSWVKVATKSAILSMSILNTETIYASFWDGAVGISTDKCASWKYFDPANFNGSHKKIEDIAVLTSKKYIVINSLEAWITENSGDFWQKIPLPKSNGSDLTKIFSLNRGYQFKFGKLTPRWACEGCSGGRD